MIILRRSIVIGRRLSLMVIHAVHVDVVLRKIGVVGVYEMIEGSVLSIASHAEEGLLVVKEGKISEG